jgi:hypothetical protein
MLERVGILTWANRLTRVREYVPGLFGFADLNQDRLGDVGGDAPGLVGSLPVFGFAK